MKHIRLSSLFAILALALFSNKSWAQGGSVEGFYGVGSVSTSQAGATSGVSGRYWSEYVGGEFGLQYTGAKADAEGTDILDQNSFGIGASFLAGIPMENLKPHISLGFIYAKSSDDINDLDSNEFDLTASLGIDIAPTENLLIGLDFLRFATALSAEIETTGAQTDIDASLFSAFSGFRVGYRF